MVTLTTSSNTQTQMENHQRMGENTHVIPFTRAAPYCKVDKFIRLKLFRFTNTPVAATLGVVWAQQTHIIAIPGTHFNGACCFDYGNSENNQLVPWRGGAGSMEAIYFGNAHWNKQTGVGSGPWVRGSTTFCKQRRGCGQCVRPCVHTCVRLCASTCSRL
jgi:hypothetical protein